MKLIKPFDPTVGTSGIIESGGINTNEQIVLYNDSLVGLSLQFADGSSDVLPASWAKDYIIKSTPMGQIKWFFYNTVTLINYPISSVYGALYEPGEHVAPVNSPIPRAFSVGNTGAITTSGGGGLADHIVNDGNVAGTSIVEATVSGDAGGSAVSISNDAHVSLGTVAHPALLQLVGSIGNTTIDTAGAVTIANRLFANLVRAISGNDLALGVETAHKIALQINAADVIQITASSLKLLAGVASTIIANILKADATTDLKLNADTGQKITFQINNVEIGRIDAAGMNCNVFQAKTGIGANTKINAETGQTITLQINNVEIARIDSTGLVIPSLALTSTSIANSGDVQAASFTIKNAGSGGNPRFYANSPTPDASAVFQSPVGTDTFRLETDGALTAMGALHSGLGSLGVKRSLIDDTGSIVYFKAPSAVIYQIPNGTTVFQISSGNNGGTISNASTLAVGGDIKLGVGGSGLNNNYFFADGSKQSGIHQFTASSGVATNHGCNKTPQGISAVPNGAATTLGVTALTSTQITITTGSGVSSYCICSTFN